MSGAAEIIVLIVVSLVASLGAGLGTGLAGLSAAAVIAPMLATFLGVNTYEAVAIALASDILASAVSAFVYAKNKNIDIKNGLLMMACVLVFCVIGTFVGLLFPQKAMGILSIFGTTFIGLKFIIFPEKEGKEPKQRSKKMKIILSIAVGCIIGFQCGFVGIGGGMLMLFALNMLLGYELKKAVGTSVFIMSVTALTGSVGHFALIGIANSGASVPSWLSNAISQTAGAGSIGMKTWQEWAILGICIVFTMVFAQVAAIFANKVNKRIQNLATGITLTVLGVVMLVFQIVTFLAAKG
ncbi:MAG: sulfite exporter TauE/SafE family protein [Bacilli bacterium]|nr:sulfite exporter TauE/SafE family protein [Bacilli bacterium]